MRDWEAFFYYARNDGRVMLIPADELDRINASRNKFVKAYSKKSLAEAWKWGEKLGKKFPVDI
jgi:hypothetical protein